MHPEPLQTSATRHPALIGVLGRSRRRHGRAPPARSAWSTSFEGDVLGECPACRVCGRSGRVFAATVSRCCSSLSGTGRPILGLVIDAVLASPRSHHRVAAAPTVPAWRRALVSMSRKGPSVIGTGDAPDRRLFFSGPGGLVTLPPRRVAPPCGPSLPSRPVPPCGGS